MNLTENRWHRFQTRVRLATSVLSLELALYVALYVALALGEKLPSVLAGLVIFVAVPLIWFEALVMWRRTVARPDLFALRIAAEHQLVASEVALIFALVFLNNGMEVPILDLQATRVVTRLSILTLGLPGLHFLWVRRGRWWR